MEGHIFFKMPFRPCPSGCGRFLYADDGHERCLQCLGLQHTEDAFVDDRSGQQTTQSRNLTAG